MNTQAVWFHGTYTDGILVLRYGTTHPSYTRSNKTFHTVGHYYRHCSYIGYRCGGRVLLLYETLPAYASSDYYRPVITDNPLFARPY